jgi:transcriptional regulator with XRE-family HTH domain
LSKIFLLSRIHLHSNQIAEGFTHSGEKMGDRRSIPRLGTAIRSRRRQLNLTLNDISEKTGLSVGFLSQIERDLASPSISSLVNIATAIDLSLDYFLTPPVKGGLLTRREDRKYFTLNGLPIQYARVSNDFPNVQLHGTISKIPSGWESEETVHEGEDFVFQVSGQSMVRVGGEEHLLNPGDTIHYDANIPHSWGNPTDQDSVCLTVGTQPLFAVRGLNNGD